MTDLSYTNKDGLNPATGFTNVYDYHKDGAAEGDGYAHGGYPEITGETSDYTDTSYKTGDNPDFFNNGNVWEQPSVGPGPGPGPEPEPGAKVIDQTGILTQLFINADASDEELAEVVRKGLETWGSSTESMHILFSTISDFTQEQPGEGDILVMASCEESSGSENGGAVDIFFMNYGTQEFYQYAIAYNYGNRTGVYDSNTSSPTAGQKMSGIIALPAVAGNYQGVVVTSASENPPATWSEHPEVIVPVVSFNENPWAETE